MGRAACSLGVMGTLSEEALATRARAWAVRTCAAQGVAVKVGDPVTLATVAMLVSSGVQTRQSGSTRDSSKVVRPGTARSMTARSRMAATTARCRASDSPGQSSRSTDEAPT